MLTIGITPQTYFHDLFAGHTDSPAKWSSGETEAIHKAGTDCHFNDLAATSPYVHGKLEIVVPAIVPVSVTPTPLLTKAAQSPSFWWEGRGPPAIG